MKLQSLQINGFRRIFTANVIFGDATFLIGENNVGKSSILEALSIFFSTNNTLEEQDYYYDVCSDKRCEHIVFEAHFIDLPDESRNWRGFVGRVFEEEINGQKTLGIYYRKTFPRGEKLIREMRSYNKALKQEYSKCKTINDFISAGLPIEEIDSVFPNFPKNEPFKAAQKELLELIPTAWNVEGEINWITNPGGIEGNILTKLPSYIQIPADDNREEIESSNGALQKIMKELFDEVRSASSNYAEAQKYLNLLSAELDPTDNTQEFGKMMEEVNDIVGDIFTETKLDVTADLTNPDSAIKPTFNVQMSSNVKTHPKRQGSGSIRSAVFALLRYREQFLDRHTDPSDYKRTILIGFEEPELFLHPNAANLMRDKIYELATSSHSKIICTTHSPYLIDLGVKIDSGKFPDQVLNLVKIEPVLFEGNQCYASSVTAFNTKEAYLSLVDDEKDYVKFILKMDDYLARVFFSKNVIVIEGDTEDIVLRETIKRLPIEKRKKIQSEYQIVKARGKPAIIALVKYLKSLGINPFVIHDNDTADGAVVFNKHILAAIDGDEEKRFIMVNNIEDVIGIEKTTGGKPYSAYKHVKENWGDSWDSIQENWKEIIEKKIFKITI